VSLHAAQQRAAIADTKSGVDTALAAPLAL